MKFTARKREITTQTNLKDNWEYGRGYRRRAFFMENKMVTCKTLDEIAKEYCQNREYKICFWKDEKEIDEVEVDYEEFYEILRRYHCMRDTLELITNGTVIK